MARELQVYSYVPHAWHASFYYRILVPFDTARDLGIKLRLNIDRNDGSMSPDERVTRFCESDVVLFYQPVGEGVEHNSRIAKSILPSKRNGEWKYPPTLIVETDDNLFDVSPYNQAYRHLGVRDGFGKLLQKGHLIGDIQGGRRRLLWHDEPCNENCDPQAVKDGRPPNCGKGMDIHRNQQNITNFRNLIEMADCVTCTTPRVKEAVLDNTDARRVEVFPNLVRFDHYEQVHLHEEPGKVKILWQGGASHYEDWMPLREALGKITRMYPQVEWLIWGQMYDWVTELIPPDRFRFINWCDYREYKLRLVTMGHDINLAPLADTRFNRCRSAIKFYEGSVLRKPAATLAQRTGPYADEIVDGETGLLFDHPHDFVDKLSLLIENETKRKELAANAKDWVSENRDAMKCVPRWAHMIEELRASVERTHPRMPDGQWDEFIARMEAQEKAAAEATDEPVQPVNQGG